MKMTKSNEKETMQKENIHKPYDHMVNENVQISLGLSYFVSFMED